ncbi:4'-phosphopantetheinyl transferase family protein [Salana multivorans]
MKWRCDGAWAAAAPLDSLAQVRASAFTALSEAERARLRGLNDTRADEVLLGRWLLRSLVVGVLGQGSGSPGEVRDVVVDAHCSRCGREHGRPRLPGLPLLASIAHAGGLVVVAVAASGRWAAVGVDTEPLGAQGLEDPELRRWTEREAVGKARGVGIAADDDEGELPSSNLPGSPLPGWRLERLPTPGHLTTLALREPAAPGQE